MTQIYLGKGLVDFHVNKKKYSSYKSKNGRTKYAEQVLKELLEQFKGQVSSGIIMKDLTVESNDFWGKPFTFINDLGYNNSYQPPARDEELTIRVFGLRITGLVQEEKDKQFISEKRDSIHINSSMFKIV